MHQRDILAVGLRARYITYAKIMPKTHIASAREVYCLSRNWEKAAISTDVPMRDSRSTASSVPDR